MKGGAHLSPFAALSFSVSKKAPTYCWVDRVFQLLDGEVQPQTRGRPATSYTISKTLLPLDYGTFHTYWAKVALEDSVNPH